MSLTPFVTAAVCAGTACLVAVIHVWVQRRRAATKRVAVPAAQPKTMTDDELTALVAEHAVLEPHTAEGTRAMFALAGRLGDERANEVVSLRGFVPFPSAVLYRAGTLEPVLADSKAKLSDSPAAAWFDELDEAALVLALVPHAIPAEAAHWMHVDDPDVALLVQRGISRSNASDVEPPSFHQAPSINEAQIAGLVAAYRKLPKGHRDRVTLAIGRLLRGRCQSNPGNRAIDVAIALEVLFMSKDRNEHSYKISLRAARLLQEDVGARRKVFAEVKNVYDVRSGMVHTGSADNESNVDGVKRTAHDVVEAVDVVCTEAICRFLAMGSIPENLRDIELS